MLILSYTKFNKIADSETKQIRNVLTNIEFEVRKPLQLIREMKNLAMDRISEVVLCTLWLKRLPIRVQIILSANEMLIYRKWQQSPIKFVFFYNE